MKLFKKIFIVVAVVAVFVPAITFAYVREKGDWSEWWKIGLPASFTGINVKRIYDKENKLVCWVVATPGGDSVGIDCNPSLELGYYID